MSRYFVDPKTDKIERQDLYKVTLHKSDGTTVSDLLPKRLFPFTRPTRYITLLSDDGKKEAAVITDISLLDSDSRKAVEDCFGEFYMIPTIIKVIEANSRYGSATMKVVTDRGEISFRVRNINSDIKMMDDKRMLIRDNNDNRYEIPDINALDKKSMKKLFSYT